MHCRKITKIVMNSKMKASLLKGTSQCAVSTGCPHMEGGASQTLKTDVSQGAIFTQVTYSLYTDIHARCCYINSVLTITYP